MKKLIVLSALLLAVSLLFAEKITFSANSMSGSTDSDKSDTKLKGEAYILTKSMEIFADEIILSGEDYNNITAKGNVKGKNFDSQMEFTCGSLEYDRTTEVAVLKNNVDLKDTENDVTAKAQLIEYNSKTDIAVLQISINLTQKDNTCTGSYAVYHKKEQMLELSGNAKIKQKDDTFRAQHISLNMDTQEITLNGRVNGSVTDKNDDSSADGKSKSKKGKNGKKSETAEKSEAETSEMESSAEPEKIENEQKSGDTTDE